MDILSAHEAAAHLGVKPATLYAYVSRGLLDSVPRAGDTRRRGYRKSDVDRLRRRRDAHAGHGAAAAGALDWGAPSLDTAISRITDDGPAYHGHPVAELVRAGTSFEAAAELLWTGVPPAAQPRWTRSGASPVTLPGFPPDGAHPIDILRGAVLLAGLEDPRRFTPSDATKLDIARELIVRAVATLTTYGGHEPARDGRLSTSVAAAFGLEATDAMRRALDGALVVIADHELNASTFAARVAASTGADLYASVSAALATLSGPLHGGACDRCASLVAEIEAAGSAREVLGARVRRGEAPPGFGHRLYPAGDPRFVLLRALAEEYPGAPTALAGEIILSAEAMGLGAPTSDLGLVLLARAVGLPDRAAVTLFAVGRMAGWIAHALEQGRQGFLLRPRARYVGK